MEAVLILVHLVSAEDELGELNVVAGKVVIDLVTVMLIHLA